MPCDSIYKRNSTRKSCSLTIYSRIGTYAGAAYLSLWHFVPSYLLLDWWPIFVPLRPQRENTIGCRAHALKPMTWMALESYGGHCSSPEHVSKVNKYISRKRKESRKKAILRDTRSICGGYTTFTVFTRNPNHFGKFHRAIEPGGCGLQVRPKALDDRHSLLLAWLVLRSVQLCRGPI